MQLFVPFILASASPRRRHLLRQIGFTFAVKASHIDEIIPEGLSPDLVVKQLARQKAESVAAEHPEALTLGADTIVVLENDILGKPQTESEACRMLGRLSGKTHTVYTGIALLHPATGRDVTASVATEVTFCRMTPEEIQAYVATGSPLDKAGAYGIQDDRGALFISRINGDYYNVVGLPLHRLYCLLREEFSDLFDPVAG